MECPVEGCHVKSRSAEGLYAHLYFSHRKSDIIRALLTILGMSVARHHAMPSGKLVEPSGS